MKKNVLLLISLLLYGCGASTVSVTQVINLDTDTYISNGDNTDHANLPYLKVSKSASLEERSILKLPTGSVRDPDQELKDIMANPLTFLTFGYFYIFIAILEDLLDCQTSVLQPANLTSAKFVLDVSNNSGGDLTSKLTMQLLAKPWWQNVSWEAAHYFSDTGRWVTPGGDTDPTFTPIVNATGTDGTLTTVEFDITNYFRTLITNQTTTHYGVLLSANGSTLPTVTLASTQATTGSVPRIVSVYTGTCTNKSSAITENIYYLGRH